MRWSFLSGGAALLAAAGLLSACAGSGGSAVESKVAHGADLVQRDSGLGRRPPGRGARRLQAFLPQADHGPRNARSSPTAARRRSTAAEWKTICDAAAAVKDSDTRAARRFFEENFRPLVVQAPGKFTGYFEPELRGSRAPSRHLHRAGLSPAARSRRRALLHARRDRAGRAQGQGTGDRLGAGPGGAVRSAGPGQRPHPSRRRRHAQHRLRRLQQPALHGDRRRAGRHGRDAARGRRTGPRSATG